MLSAAPLLFVAAGCRPNRVDGLIDGERVEVDASIVAITPDALDDDDLVTVTLTGVQGPCPAYGFVADAAAGTAAERAEAWSTSFPETFWEVELVLRTDRALARDDVLTGLPWDAYLEASGTAFATFRHHRRWRDEAYYGGEADDLDYTDTWFSDQGAVQVLRAREGEILKGRFATRVVDLAGGGSDEVEVHFKASPCAASADTSD